jgi:hypothetical protein
MLPRGYDLEAKALSIGRTQKLKNGMFGQALFEKALVQAVLVHQLVQLSRAYAGL